VVQVEPQNDRSGMHRYNKSFKKLTKSVYKYVFSLKTKKTFINVGNRRVECTKYTAMAQVAEPFEPSTVLWAFHTMQPSSSLYIHCSNRILSVQMSVISFADKVDFSTDHPCYSTDLALMTPTNKDKLTAFAGTSISVAANIPANFSNAFKKAFSLLASSDSGEARG